MARFCETLGWAPPRARRNSPTFISCSHNRLTIRRRKGVPSSAKTSAARSKTALESPLETAFEFKLNGSSRVDGASIGAVKDPGSQCHRFRFRDTRLRGHQDWTPRAGVICFDAFSQHGFRVLLITVFLTDVLVSWANHFVVHSVVSQIGILLSEFLVTPSRRTDYCGRSEEDVCDLHKLVSNNSVISNIRIH